MVAPFRNLLRVAAMSALGLAIAGGARADITVQDPAVASSGSVYDYTYSIKVGDSQKIVSGDFFTIFDFNGLLSVVATPADWTATTQFVGITPSGVSTFPDVPSSTYVDLHGIPNVTFQYTPSDPSDEIDPNSVVGGFVLSSTEPEGARIAYAGWGTVVGGEPGEHKANVAKVDGPRPVPEGGSLALLLPMAAPLGLVFRRRR